MEPGTPRATPRASALDTIRRFVWSNTLAAVNEDLAAFSSGTRTEPHVSALAVRSAIRAIKNTRALSGPNKEITLGRLNRWNAVFKAE